MSDVELHPVVLDLSSSFVVKDGLLVMEPEDARTHLKRLQSVDAAERPLVAEHLVALAFRFRAQAADAAEGSIALLLAFTVATLDGATDKAASLFANAGLEQEAAAVFAERSAAAAIGKARTLAAPRAEDVQRAAPSVKPKRGLR